MKKIIWFVLLMLLSCNSSHHKTWRNDFNAEEKKLMKLSRELISRAYFGTLVTVNEKGELRTRIMEPLAPDSTFTVYMATNKNSRKVKEIKNNPRATLFYFDRSAPGYVSLYGHAYIINDRKTLAGYWQKAWEQHYPGRKNYVLIRFVPYRLEMIYPAENLPGDSLTWKPYEVILRN